MKHRWWHGTRWYIAGNVLVEYCWRRKPCGWVEVTRIPVGQRRCEVCAHPFCHPHMHH